MKRVKLTAVVGSATTTVLDDPQPIALISKVLIKNKFNRIREHNFQKSTHPRFPEHVRLNCGHTSQVLT